MINMQKIGTDLSGTMVEPGQVVEVSEEDAKMFCDTKYSGHYGFEGERFNDTTMHDYRRAVRVA